MLSAQNDLISSLKLGENEQNCYSILARLFPGQTVTNVMVQHSSSVNKHISHVTCSSANSSSSSSNNSSAVRQLATPPLQQEQQPGVPRQWELLSRPLPPIQGDSDDEIKFHNEISQIKKKVRRSLL